MIKRNKYLKTISLDEAKKLITDTFENINNLTGETIDTKSSINRILAEPVSAKRSSPPFNVSAMDGVAVKSNLLKGASLYEPVILTGNDSVLEVDTGDFVPKDYDAVVKIEDITQKDSTSFEFTKEVTSWQHIRCAGEDIFENDILFVRGHKIRSFDIGTLLAAGILELKVFNNLKIAIIPTGTELIEPEETPNPGDVVEYNSKIIKNQLKEWGIDCYITSKVRDNIDELVETVRQNIKSTDIVVVIAGSSSGKEDLTQAMISKTGTLIFHGIAVMPGKPTLCGKIENKPVIGIPGYPVSAWVAINTILKHTIEVLNRTSFPSLPLLEAQIAWNRASTAGLEEWVRVILGKINNKWIAMPMGRGAGNISTLSGADGHIILPSAIEGVKAKTNMKVRLLKPKKELERTLLMCGSHDMTIDILKDELRQNTSPYNLVSSHVGSLSGLIALRDGLSHLAGSHLIDPDTGEYNVTYIKKYLNEQKCVLIHLVKRTQGLMVKKGNPLNIKDVKSLIKDNIVFINRQKGSGTRILFDLKIKEENIKRETIKGYEREMNTHLGVAMIISGGQADCGMGILAAAKAVDLDFIPIVTERYDLVLPEDHLKLEGIKLLLKCIEKNSFKASINKLGGYQTDETGSQLSVVSCL